MQQAPLSSIVHPTGSSHARKRAFRLRPCMFAVWSRLLPLQRRQRGEVRCDAARLVAGKQLGSSASPRLILEIDIRQRVTVVILDDEAGIVGLIDSPWRREAAVGSKPFRKGLRSMPSGFSVQIREVSHGEF